MNFLPPFLRTMLRSGLTVPQPRFIRQPTGELFYLEDFGDSDHRGYRKWEYRYLGDHLKLQRWRPDTCRCVVIQCWDQTTPRKYMKVVCSKIERLCGRHEYLRGKGLPVIYAAILETNKRRDKFIRRPRADWSSFNDVV